MENNNLDILLKQTLSEEFLPSAALDRATQLKMQSAVDRKQSKLVTSLSIIGLVIFSVIAIFLISQIHITSLQVIFILLNANIFTLFIFFLIINHKNRKEPYYELN